mmetsp:Transcript_19370/g.44068  ORF Transcript_19370/g.44068 Transcript_19370/m.44068 type:complete len:416 (-) Transcript_19370:157-1404(-)
MHAARSCRGGQDLGFKLVAQLRHDAVVEQRPREPADHHVLEAVDRPVILREELSLDVLVAGVDEAFLEVLYGHNVFIVDVCHKIHEVAALLVVLVGAHAHLLSRGVHEQRQALASPARAMAREGHEGVHGVRVDGEAHVGEDLEKQSGLRLRRPDAREGVEVVRVARATAVREGSRHKANVLALALVALVVIHARELGQLGMHGVDVVEVDEVLRDELPVALDFVVLDGMLHQLIQVIARELQRQVAKRVQQGRRARALVQEDQAREGLHPRDGQETQVLLALFGRHGRRGGLQRAVEAVRPPVVRADQLLAVRGVRGAHLGAAMSAHVVEGVDLHRFVPGEDDRCAADVHDLHVAGSCQIRGVRRAEPLGAEEALALRVGVGVICVEGRVQRLCHLYGSCGRPEELLQLRGHGR